MIYILAIGLLLTLLIAPQFWVKHVIKKHNNQRDDLQGNGEELAKHLIKRFNLPVTVEVTNQGDHYDPNAKAVRLHEDHVHKKSLTSIAIAAHEVGHAIQHNQQSSLFHWRTRLAIFAHSLEKVSSAAFIIIPIAAAMKVPHISFLMAAIIAGSLFAGVLVHLATLPLEWDASFGQALPILQDGGYLSDNDLTIVKQILRAAAFTYVASSLMSFLNIWRWLRVLRR